MWETKSYETLKTYVLSLSFVLNNRIVLLSHKLSILTGKYNNLNVAFY